MMFPMKTALLALGQDTIRSTRDLIPIIVVIGVFQWMLLRQPAADLLPLAYGAVAVVAGLTLFIYGLRVALYPVGETLAHSLARKGSVGWLITFAFLLGFGPPIMEPALIAVAGEAANVAVTAEAIDSSAGAKEQYALGLRLTVAIAVGVALVLGVIRILVNWSLHGMIIGGYLAVVLVTGIAPKEIIVIAYDSGGVTTSTVTVPLVAALGVGLASSLRDRSPMLDGFGLIAFASLTPILFVLVFGILVQWN